VLRVPLRLLMEEPERVGVAVAATLRQRGWSPRRAACHPAAARGALPLGDALDPALDQALGPAVGVTLGASPGRRPVSWPAIEADGD
jgi:hypothetical protein